jgi:N-acetylglucosaminyldiphosphoundecaprenol N-acetyl-beta-D-mannosaminyltransferase
VAQGARTVAQGARTVAQAAPAVTRARSGAAHAVATAPRPSPAEPQVASQVPPPRRAEVLGIPLAVSDYGEVMDWMDAMIAADARGYVTAAAVNLVMNARENPATLEAAMAATLAVPDGQPLVWALRALGHRAATRVYGPDLMALYCARAARSGIPMYLYGGRGDAEREVLAGRLRERCPGLQIVGGASPPFTPLTLDQDEALLYDINSSGAQVVWVGTGQPKQEQWMHRMRPRLRAPLLVGVGAAFDFHAGLIRQAPPWMQRNGLEWSYRLMREPRRLWRRYARYNPRFVVAFAGQYARHRRRTGL